MARRMICTDCNHTVREHDAKGCHQFVPASNRSIGGTCACRSSYGVGGENGLSQRDLKNRYTLRDECKRLMSASVDTNDIENHASEQMAPGVNALVNALKSAADPSDTSDWLANYADDAVKNTDNKFADCRSIYEVVHQAIGAGSMCWENVAAAGEFNSTLAIAVGEDAMWKIDEFIENRVAQAKREARS